MTTRQLSLHAAVMEYLGALQEETGTDHGTYKAYQGVLLRLCARYPHRKYRDMKSGDLDTFLYDPKEGIAHGRAQSTGIVYRSALRSLFRYGARMGWGTAPEVPGGRHIVRGRSGARRTYVLPTRLSATQMKLMLDGAENPMLRAMLAIAMTTALRISDVLKIRMLDVDLQNGSLHIWVKKTQKYDAMPVSLDLEEELLSYLQWYTETVGVVLQDEAFLFPGIRYGFGNFSYEPQRHVSRGWAHSKLHEHFRACGIRVEQREAWHVIRRSMARMWFDRLRQDVSRDHALRDTAALLGHESATTTELYLGLTAEIEARNAAIRGQRLYGNRTVSTIHKAS